MDKGALALLGQRHVIGHAQFDGFTAWDLRSGMKLRSRSSLHVWLTRVLNTLLDVCEIVIEPSGWITNSSISLVIRTTQ